MARSSATPPPKVEWHPGELYPRVGFIVTNLSRPAERVVVFYNKRGTCEQWIKEGNGAIKWTRLSVLERSRPTPCASSSMRSPATSEISCACWRRPTNQGLVADEPEGEADQDWCEGREPRSPCRLPDGRGRDPTANVPGDIAAHCGTAAAATTSASVRRSMVMRSRATAGRSAPECQGKMARSDTRTPLGRPGMLEAIHTAHLRYIQFRRRL